MAMKWCGMLTGCNHLSAAIAWCRRHGANRMIHLSKNVVTSGIAWYMNMIYRK
ncbi:hypothetical protein EVA_18552 [gut metagenome]|uniref:Uncharacterized protein n=1 Tax=gut metagenome TaxID=749906 RepID=J9FEJ7_9ZZZZ